MYFFLREYHCAEKAKTQTEWKTVQYTGVFSDEYLVKK